VKRAVGELRTARPMIYRIDFLLSLAIGGVCFYVVRVSPLFSPMQVLCFIVCGLLYYRAAAFTQRIVAVNFGGCAGSSSNHWRMPRLPHLLQVPVEAK
jgi:hypothetical protein